MKECDNSKIHISSNLILSICLLSSRKVAGSIADDVIGIFH